MIASATNDEMNPIDSVGEFKADYKYQILVLGALVYAGIQSELPQSESNLRKQIRPSDIIIRDSLNVLLKKELVSLVNLEQTIKTPNMTTVKNLTLEYPLTFKILGKPNL